MKRLLGPVLSVALHGTVLAAAVLVSAGVIVRPRVHSSGAEGVARVYSVGLRNAGAVVEPARREMEIVSRPEPDEIPEREPTEVTLEPEAPRTTPLPVEPFIRPDDGRHDVVGKGGDEGEAPVTGGTGRGEK